MLKLKRNKLSMITKVQRLHNLPRYSKGSKAKIKKKQETYLYYKFTLTNNSFNNQIKRNKILYNNLTLTNSSSTHILFLPPKIQGPHSL